MDSGAHNTLDFWKTSLGLLPVPLIPHAASDATYVMLNGSRGNFCLDLTGSHLSNRTRNIAWSTNVGHYVSILGDLIEVQRWDDSPASVERYAAASVTRDAEAFHRYLEDHSPKAHLSVVSHGLRVFRKLRALLGPRFDGGQSLSAFLYLLGEVASRELHSYSSQASSSSSNAGREIASAIRPLDWIALEDELRGGPKNQGLSTDLTLTLTHAAGDLFQEAHFEAITVPQDQLTLEGILPRPGRLVGKPHIKGIHFTPPAIARTLVEEAIHLHAAGTREIRIFDPACGSGEFLRESLRQLRLIGYAGEIHLTGWDISPAACEIASFSLAFDGIAPQPLVTVSIQCRNSLLDFSDWPASPDIVLMNPPFISWEDMSHDERAFIRERVPPLSTGRPDAAFAFLSLASSAIADQGVLASVVPASFLDSDSASGLRGQLRDQLTPKLFARLGSHALFARSVIDTGLFVATKPRQGDVVPTVLWADFRSQSTSAALRALRKQRHLAAEYPILGEGYSIYANPTFANDATTWAPRPYKSWVLSQSLSDWKRVADLFNVRQGVRTGANSVFVLTREAFMRLPEGERAFFRPAITNRSIRNGFLSQRDYLFYPYGVTPIMTEADLVAAVPVYFSEYLDPNRPQLVSRSRITERNWWHLSEHRAWQEDPLPKIVSTYFGDVGSFAWDDGGDYVVVQGFGWIPRNVRPRGLMATSTGQAYLAILSSDLFSSLLSAHSNHVAGGQWNLSRKFVDRIPVPDLFSEDVAPDRIRALALLGHKIQTGQPFDADLLNDLVEDIYTVRDQMA